MYFASNTSYFSNIADENGLNTAILNSPMRIARVMGGVRNCHIETPAARATTNSWYRFNRQKANIAPSRAEKGIAFSVMVGTFNNAIEITAWKEMSSCRTETRRNSSSVSKMVIMSTSPRENARKDDINWRPIYKDKVRESFNLLVPFSAQGFGHVALVWVRRAGRRILSR